MVRGWDLLSSAPRQMYLQELFGFPHPDYGHVPLLLAPDGRRLSKRDEDMDLTYLQKHLKAEQLLGILAYSCGLIDRPEAISAKELSKVFQWEKVKKEDIHLNISQYIK